MQTLFLSAYLRIKPKISTNKASSSDEHKLPVDLAKPSSINTEPYPNDALKTPRKYDSSVLREYTEPVLPLNDPSLPGELGNLIHVRSAPYIQKRMSSHFRTT